METAAFYTWLLGTVTVGLTVVFAILTGSLTLLGDGARGMLMVVVLAFSLWMLRAVHRDRLARLEYGIGKVEQFVWVTMGLGFIIVGLWVGQTVIDTLFSSEPAASPLGLTSAAVIKSISTLIHVLSWFTMVIAVRTDASPIFIAQRHAWLILMVSSLFLQATLTAAALAQDAWVALILDTVGALFVTGVMLYKGFSMITRALPNLLDAPAGADLSAQIRTAVASVLPEDDIVSIRTRRSGPVTFAEVKVNATPSMSPVEHLNSVAMIKDTLRRDGAAVDLAVVPTVDGRTVPGGA